MSDTARTRTAILALFADNVTGQISAQDLRDFLVTVMPAEFENVGDFWKFPAPAQLVDDKSYRGWVDYSQIMISACSFGDALYLAGSGTWGTAHGAQSVRQPTAGLACASYAAADSQCIVLRAGLICMTALSLRMAGSVGRTVYLTSNLSGQYSITKDALTSLAIIGIVVPNGIGSENTYKLRFDPSWAVMGA